MPLEDYAHWNEEQHRVWWEEEGKHQEEPPDLNDYEREYGPADAFAEELAEEDTLQLKAMLDDEDYCRRWPEAAKMIKQELQSRGALQVEPDTYRIMRFRFKGDNEEIKNGLTLEEAQEWCNREDTRGHGWFDGYEKERK